MSLDLKRLFDAQKVAVIGASATPSKLGGVVMTNLTKSYTGTIYPVNPKGGEMYDLPVVKSIDDLPEDVDLAVLALSAEMAVDALAEVGKRGIPFAIIFAGGYAEIGNHELEDRIRQICTETGIHLVGPNGMGLWNVNGGLNASFMSMLPTHPGKVTFLSQSGSLIAFAIYVKIRMGKFVSLGNSTDMTFEKFIPYLAKDDETKVLALYIESLKDGRTFLETIKHFPKPVVAVQAGMTEAGQRSIASHTAALAGNVALYSSLLDAYGITQVKSFEIMASLTRAFELLPPPKNNKVVALSNAGGAVCLFSDACSEFGLDTAPLPEGLAKKLREVFPPQAPVNNPLDLTVTGSDPKILNQVFDLLFDTSLHDYGMVVYIPVVPPYADPMMDAQLAIEMNKKTPVPFMTCLLVGDKVRPVIPELDKAGIAYCESIRETAEVLGHYYKWYARQKN